MTREHVLALLLKCQQLTYPENDAYDAERAHHYADLALLAYLNDPEITAAWEAVKKWYS